MNDGLMIFTCEDSFEATLTAIFYAFLWGNKIGPDKIRIRKEPIRQYEFFYTYKHIDFEEDKYSRVADSIINKISQEAYWMIYNMSLSDEADAVDAIYAFLRSGYKYGPKIMLMYTLPEVMRAFEIKRRVDNERGLSREFVRFASLDNRLYVAHLSPKSNIVPAIAWHFADRMPSEYWVIVDDNRNIAAVHPANEQFFIRHLDEESMEKLKPIDDRRDEYSDMWKSFFTAISIKERENKKCQDGHFPIWMRKHATEFK